MVRFMNQYQLEDLLHVFLILGYFSLLLFVVTQVYVNYFQVLYIELFFCIFHHLTPELLLRHHLTSFSFLLIRFILGPEICDDDEIVPETWERVVEQFKNLSGLDVKPDDRTIPDPNEGVYDLCLL